MDMRGMLIGLIGGMLFLVWLSYKEKHKNQHYPKSIQIDGEITPTDSESPRQIHLEIQLENKER